MIVRQTLIEARVVVTGFHRWPDAPPEVSHLADRHRHLFVIRARKTVADPNRGIEFQLFGRSILEYIVSRWPPQPILHALGCEFASYSCEEIADDLVTRFDLSECSVHEDDENGAIVRIVADA
jgi:hypothetical protein